MRFYLHLHLHMPQRELLTVSAPLGLIIVMLDVLQERHREAAVSCFCIMLSVCISMWGETADLGCCKKSYL